MGQRGMSSLRAFPLWGLTEGQHNNVPSTLIPPRGLFDSFNVVVSEGAIKPRPGWTEYAATGSAVPCNHVSAYQNAAGTILLMRSRINLATNEVEILSTPSPFTTWTSRATLLAGGEDYPPGSAQFKSEWLFIPGDGEMHRYTGGATAVTIDSLQADTDLQPPNAPRFICANQSRVFLGNAIDPVSAARVPFRVWWCAKSNSTVWSHGSGKPETLSSGFQDLSHDNTAITGMYFHGGSEVLAYKERSFYIGIFKGPPLYYDFEIVSSSHGCVAGATIQSWRDLVIWLGNDNVYARTTGSKSVVAIGDSIRSSLAFTVEVNRATAMIDPVKGIYYLFVPRTATGDNPSLTRVYACSLRDKFAWTEGEIAPGKRVMDAYVFHSEFANSGRLLLGVKDGKIYTSQNNMVDMGTNFDAWFWGKTLDAAEVFTREGAETQTLQKLHFDGDGGKVTGRIRKGTTLREVETAAAISFGEFDQTSTTYPTPLGGTNHVARYFQVGGYWTAGSTAPMAVAGATAWMMPAGDVRG